MSQFDPNAAASDDSGVFGLPFSGEEALLHLLPVPWEATTSYGGGTSKGPVAILEASRQVDLFDREIERPYEPGIFFREPHPNFEAWNREGKQEAQKIIAVGGELAGDKKLLAALKRVNDLSESVNGLVLEESRAVLASGKILALLGGDHSTPFGAIQAATEHFGDIGILHFDAHSDTRVAFEGFSWSHASIMHNVLERIPGIKKLVQVGIRDFCEQEFEYCREQKGRVDVFYDVDLARRKFSGETWKKISEEIVSKLPEKVWVSFDIDGLDPRFCPHTGTPVPGGLDFQEANYILRTLALSGKTIVGFDLNEVAPGPDGDEWDANVGARLLYKLCGWTLVAQKKVRALN